MSFEDAIATIISLNREIEAVKILMGWIEKNTEYIEKDNAEMSACLKAIKKINRGSNCSISALCERG